MTVIFFPLLVCSLFLIILTTGQVRKSVQIKTATGRFCARLIHPNAIMSRLFDYMLWGGN